MEYYLGVDWGEKKCGTALADKETRLAFAGEIFFTKNFAKELEALKKKFFIRKIILGISQNYFFSSENQKAILKFKERLETSGEQVFLQEEFFSTRMAQNNFREKRGEGKKAKKEDDAESAKIILQSWLDKKKEDC